MSDWSLSAALLAAALMVAPPPRRILPRRRRPGRKPPTPVVVAGVGVALLLAAGPPIALAGGLVAGTAGVRRRRHRVRHRRRDEGQSLAGALEVLVGELLVGSHPKRGFAVAAAESTGPVAEALGGVVARARLGADVMTGLRACARRSSVPQYWSRIAVYWGLASEHGLPMSMLMQAAFRDVTERLRFADRADAALAGARATAVVLACLPGLGVLLGQLIGARPVHFLLGGGGWVLTVGAALLCAGVLWSDHIIDRARR